MSECDVHNPLVSIVIPVYNGSNYLKQAIDSALAQTYKNIEVIVVNDGSNDNGATERIALSYGDKIRYFSKPNGGVSSALNRGITEMRGQYFSWLSHDDIYAPRKIENQISLLAKFSESNNVALCSSRQIDSENRFINGNGKDRFNGEQAIEWQKALYSVIKDGAFNGCALLIPKIVFEKCGVFNEKYRYIQDSEMWMRIFAAGFSLVYSTDCDVYNRIHAKQQTQTNRSRFYSESRELADEMLQIFSEKSTTDYNYVYGYAYRCAHHGNKELVKKSREYSKNSARFSLGQKIILKAILCYGRIRPVIRKAYYKFFRKIKVT